MVVCGRTGPVEHLFQLPWRALGGSYGGATLPQPLSSMTNSTESSIWQPTFGGGSAFVDNNNGGGRGMKRSISDSDMDDVFDDSSPKGTPTQSNDSCQMLNRKKRRGIIEKRRRDRINSSLTELRRLVPTAFEKQGSAKLEKAEILQMTVDHLKMLHAKGFDAFSFDPHKFAADYHSIGFRECAAEVARYLVTVEGMDIQDPLRLRLMSHLQCYSAQRELAAKQANTWNAFSSVTAPPPPPPPPQPSPSSNSSQFPATATTASSTPHQHHQQQQQQQQHQQHHHHHLHSQNVDSHQMHTSGVHHPLTSLSCSVELPRLTETGSSGGSVTSHMRLVPHGSHPHPPPPPPLPLAPPASSTGSLQNTMTHSLGQMHSQYPVSININTHGFTSMSPSGYSPSSTTQSGHPVKPYRPWGTELAY